MYKNMPAVKMKIHCCAYSSTDMGIPTYKPAIYNEALKWCCHGPGVKGINVYTKVISTHTCISECLRLLWCGTLIGCKYNFCERKLCLCVSSLICMLSLVCVSILFVCESYSRMTRSVCFYMSGFAVRVHTLYLFQVCLCVCDFSPGPWFISQYCIYIKQWKYLLTSSVSSLKMAWESTIHLITDQKPIKSLLS